MLYRYKNFIVQYIYMPGYKYFDEILKRKRTKYFNNAEISRMTPRQIQAYKIMGNIKRRMTNTEINYYNNIISSMLNRLTYK